MSKIEYTVDWFSCSSKEASNPEFPLDFEPEYNPMETPMRGYQYSFQYTDGRIVSISNKQGCFIQYGGKALNLLPCDYKSVIRYHLERGFNASRIDLTIDAIDTGLSIKSLYKAFELGEADCGAKKASIIESVGGGLTVYIGSRTSDRCLRIYDKGIESGSHEAGKRIRIELELKGDEAIKASKAILSAKNEGDFIAGMIKGFCDFPSNKHWGKVMKAEKIKIKSDKRKESNTRLWIMTQVAQAIAKTYKEGDTEIIQDLYNELSEILKNR